MKLRVLFIARSTYDTVRGGDTLQMVCTARELERLGVSAEIRKSSDRIDYGRYDLVHLFNLIRPADHLKHIEKSGLPCVLSTIYLDYSAFDTGGRSLPARLLFRAAGKQGSEYLKNCYRALNGQDGLASASYLLGHRASVRRVLGGVRMLLPNSISEYRRLTADYPTETPYRVIPNGIDRSLFETLPAVEREADRVLCVGQIYGLKAQHTLIEATRRLGARLTVIGKPPPNHRGYYDYCRRIAHPRVEFHDFMPQGELIRHYAGARVHALPSWFETTGLSTLEAGAMGCNLVAGSGGDTHEYFDGYASFCDPRSQESVTAAVKAELERPAGSSFRDIVLERYTWERAARMTLDAYSEILANGK